MRCSGQEEYERLRPMSYSKSHVILIAFAIDTPDSLDNVTVKWIEEVRSICGTTIPVILVGCKSDLRPPEGAASSRAFVSRADAERVAQAIGARAYKECSALKIEGVDDVFEAATRASMLMREGVPAHVPSARRERRRSGGVGWRQGQGQGQGQGLGAWEGGRSRPASRIVCLAPAHTRTHARTYRRAARTLYMFRLCVSRLSAIWTWICTDVDGRAAVLVPVPVLVLVLVLVIVIVNVLVMAEIDCEARAVDAPTLERTLEVRVA
ncbi:hypothetical protein AcV7_008410 [Taiwanofungus camphoratus]|nr:hypothetical protein AcV7_008410 [Antrodia cinnamomea]